MLDLLWHLPTGIIDRRDAPKVSEARAGKIVTLKVRVERAHRAAQSARALSRVVPRRDRPLFLIYFNGREDSKLLPVGESASSAARSSSTRPMSQIAHPDHVVPVDEAGALKPIEPVYGLTRA